MIWRLLPTASSGLSAQIARIDVVSPECLRKIADVPFLTRDIVINENSVHAGGRIDRCVQELVGGSRSFVTGLFDHQCVQLNGESHSDPGTRLQAGDRIDLRYEANRRYSPCHRPQRVHRGFQIVFEDRQVIVVNKEAGLLTVPTEGREPHTLIYRVNEHVRHEGHGRGAFLVHRLDRGVSGLLVFGKTQTVAEHLQRQFAQRKPERQYRAIVTGQLVNGEGTFRSFLATARSLTRYSASGPDSGELAVTHFRVLQRLPNATLVAVWLETGRRNQIRVHFAEAGFPVLGDTRYRPDLALKPEWPWHRLALHAATLAFEHPETAAPLRFESALPAELHDFLQAAGSATMTPAADRAVSRGPSAPGDAASPRSPARSRPAHKSTRQRRRGDRR